MRPWWQWPLEFKQKNIDFLNKWVNTNNKSILITTKKDIVRIPKTFRSLVKTIDGFIQFDDEKLLLEILTNLIENKINN